MDQKDVGRPELAVAVQRDELYFKVFEITAGDERWSVTVARRFVDGDHAFWGWHFTVDRGLVATGARAYQWQTWERALEEALTYITRSYFEPRNFRRG